MKKNFKLTLFPTGGEGKPDPDANTQVFAVQIHVAAIDAETGLEWARRCLKLDRKDWPLVKVVQES